MIRQKEFLYALLVCLVAACRAPEPGHIPGESAVHVARMDTTARAQDNFYDFAAGGWLKHQRIPEGEARWSIRDEYEAAHEKRLFELLLQVSQGSPFPEGTDNRKMVDFFQLALDSMRREQEGIAPLQPVWNQINSISSDGDMQKYLAELHSGGEDVFFSLRVVPDQTHQKPMVFIDEPKLSLPRSDLYLSYEAGARDIRAKYKTHISAMLQQVGVSIAQSQREAEQIMDVEVFLAKALERRGEGATTRSAAELDVHFPLVAWPSFFEEAGIAADSVVVSDPAYAKESTRFFSLFSREEQKAYLRWRALASAAPYLTKALAARAYSFQQLFMPENTALPPRWKLALNETSQEFGDVLARWYVRLEFDPQTNERAAELVENCKMAFASRLKELPWMSDSTKKKALLQLKEMRVHVGQPEKWKNYGNLVLEKDSARQTFYVYARSAQRFRKQQQWASALAGQDVFSSWPLSSLEARVVYDPRTNQLFVPAALLRPPYFDASANDALNYGVLGMLVSRELVTGFTLAGNSADGQGGFLSEWNEQEHQYFVTQVARLSQTWQKTNVSTRGNRQLQVSPENVADWGALVLAFEGHQRSLRENGRPDLQDDLTPEQHFFVAFTQVFAEKQANDAENGARQRINGLLSHFAPFHQAFHVQPTDKMYREERERIDFW